MTKRTFSIAPAACVHGPRFGLSLGDGLSVARVLLTPETMLNGRRIDEFFSPKFFLTEFWLLWSTLMGVAACSTARSSFGAT